ncbi:hypothetical protein [Ekhidna sp.]|uniref:hypothetical protein n=1 Tax=Ekhidna sp. TaxID=2608089 RepID=UPI003CCBE2EB
MKTSIILLVSPEPWKHIFVSKHHYAIELANRGHTVLFLNPPSDKYSLQSTEYDNLYEVNYPGFLKGLKLFPRFFRVFSTRKVFRKIELLIQSSIDILWSFDNSVFFEMSALPSHVYRISHIVDENMNFQFARAAISADLCLGSTRNIVRRLREVNENAHFINHGYSEHMPDHFSLPKTDKIRVGYAGNLDIRYIDWKLIEEIVNKHPDVEFYFAGSGSGPLFSENVLYSGKLTKTQLTGFYQAMDALMIVYRADEFPNQLANPHKMMEYLASGKPIIATLTHEYENYSSIAMSKRNGEFPDLFEQFIQNLQVWDTVALRNERMQIAIANTYHKQVSRIENLMGIS